MECLELIYRQYEREITYCIPRNQIRDALAIYLLENHVSLDASLSAVILYEHRGYKTIGHGIYELQNDAKLVYEIMEKKLNASGR